VGQRPRVTKSGNLSQFETRERWAWPTPFGKVGLSACVIVYEVYDSL